MEFLKPDTTWGLFRVQNQENFIEKFITKGKFHKNVPEAIKKDYEIVERLQFYSYYNYPLIDEAFAKSTRIFEASVDLKIKQLGIEKKGFEGLNSKLKRIEKYSTEKLLDQWNQAREIRNIFAHQKAGQLMGIVLLKAFKHNINMINTIFLNHDEILERENTLNELIERYSQLESDLFILELNGAKYLIWSMIPYATYIDNNIENSFWVFHPVYGNIIINNSSDFPDPFVFHLKNVQVTGNKLIAYTNDNNKIIVTPTEKVENLKKLTEHQNLMANINRDIIIEYSAILKNNLTKGVTNFIYESWE